MGCFYWSVYTNDQKTIVCDGPLQKMLTEDVIMDYI